MQYKTEQTMLNTARAAIKGRAPCSSSAAMPCHSANGISEIETFLRFVSRCYQIVPYGRSRLRDIHGKGSVRPLSRKSAHICMKNRINQELSLSASVSHDQRFVSIDNLRAKSTVFVGLGTRANGGINT